MKARVIAAAALLAFPGCFLASEPFSLPAPGDAQALASAVQSDSTDLDAVIGLATVLLDEGRVDEAARLLTRTYERVPDDPAVPIVLGMIEEELGTYSSARDRYELYIRGHHGILAERALERLYVIEASALRSDARRLLAASSYDEPIDGSTVVVLPAAHRGDAEGEVVAGAVQELLSRDLDAVLRRDRFTIISGRLVRILIDEMGIVPADRGEAAVAVRVGRLLGAGTVVQTDMTDTDWTVSVTTIASGGEVEAAVTDTVREDGVLDSEIAVAGMLPDLVDPGPTRRNLSVNGFRPGPTRVLGPEHTLRMDALRAFGRGLLAGDRGETQDAATELEAAVREDTRFTEARILADRALLVVDLSDRSRDATIEEVARVGERQRAVQSLRGTPGSVQQRVTATVGTGERSVLSEALGLDRVGGGVVLDVVFTTPGGSP